MSTDVKVIIVNLNFKNYGKLDILFPNVNQMNDTNQTSINFVTKEIYNEDDLNIL